MLDTCTLISALRSQGGGELCSALVGAVWQGRAKRSVHLRSAPAVRLGLAFPDEAGTAFVCPWAGAKNRNPFAEKENSTLFPQ